MQISTVARPGFLLSVALFALLVEPGFCQVTTPASILSNSFAVIFGPVGVNVQAANYTITSNVGTFNIIGSNLPAYNITAPPSASITLPPVNGSIKGISYTAYPSIPKLALSWVNWTGGDTGIIVSATLSGQIDVHISAAPIVVNPTMTLTNLPVQITFGTDWNGNAMITPSQVVVAPVDNFSSVGNCGSIGWCNGLVTTTIEKTVQTQIQSTLASQFSAALNGPNNSTPFWSGFMKIMANQTQVSVLIDPAGNPLPKVNQPTPGGTATSWNVLGDGFTYASAKMTATFYSSGSLHYIDCTPKSQAQLCGANSCGAISDGCGGTVACPGTCGGDKICTNNECTVCIPRSCESVGYTCGDKTTSNGCGGNLICNISCAAGSTCDANGQCVGTGGPNGSFCNNCRKTGGTCTSSAAGKPVCIHE